MFNISFFKSSYTYTGVAVIFFQLQACTLPETVESPLSNPIQQSSGEHEEVVFFKTLESRSDLELMRINEVVLSCAELDSLKRKKIIYDFNESGIITKQTTIFSTGRSYIEGEGKTEKWEVDADGLPLSCEVYYEGKIAHMYTYSFDFGDREKTTSYFASDGSFLSSTQSKFDLKGNVIVSVEENVIGSRIRDEFQYNDRNLKINELRIDQKQGDTLFKLRYEYEYDAAENWTVCSLISAKDTAYFLRTYVYQ